MIIHHAADVTTLFKETLNMMLYEQEKFIDLVKSPTAYSYQNLLTADTCDFEVDLAHIGLTKVRWSRFLNQYIPDRDKLEVWLEKTREQNRGVVNFFQVDGSTKVRPSIQRPDDEGHRWGPCFLGVTFALTPSPLLTLVSRTARMPTTATMELALCHLIAGELEERLRLTQRVRFCWLANQLHVTAWDLLPYLQHTGKVKAYIKRPGSFASFVNNQYTRVSSVPEVNRETLPYGRLRRIGRRVRDMMDDNPLPSLLSSDLSIWDIKRRKK